jgi:hypothetical protein
MMCAVIGCTLEADEIHTVLTPAEASYPVCENHRDRIYGGDDWLPGHEPGASPDGAPTTILMAEDLPRRVLAASATKAGGSRPGLTLRLTTVKNGESKEFEMLLPYDEGEILKGLLES